MKKYISILLILALLVLSACESNPDESVTSAPESGASFAESSEALEETSTDVLDTAKKVISTLDYANKGKMGDVDGPAFAVYSKIGVNGASVKMNIADSEINTRLGDGRYVNAYAFLGVDVYDGNPGGEWWVNCVDAGLCWSGNGGWHIFYNLYKPHNASTRTWYESSKILPRNDIYTMTLEITEDNYALLTVVGEKTGRKDSVRLEVSGAKANGSNTSFLFNTALDYPPDTKLDKQGNPCEDWTEITLANSDKGLYFRKLHVTELMLSKNGEYSPWATSDNTAVSIWPDKNVGGFDYSPTQVGIFDGDEYYINLDMNRD